MVGISYKADSLPWELTLEIFKYLNISEITCFSRTCRYLTEIEKHLLYKHIVSRLDLSSRTMLSQGSIVAGDALMKAAGMIARPRTYDYYIAASMSHKVDLVENTLAPLRHKKSEWYESVYKTTMAAPASGTDSLDRGLFIAIKADSKIDVVYTHDFLKTKLVEILSSISRLYCRSPTYAYIGNGIMYISDLNPNT